MEERKTDVVCKRCGLCCYLKDENNVPTSKKCKHLVFIGKLSSCRIYSKRIGVIIDDKETNGKRNKCGFREDDNNNYPGCPYNGG